MTLILPNTIENDTAADAAELQQNFTAIQTHVNTNLIDRNGSVAMVNPLTLPGDPTQPNHAVNKDYVDLRIPRTNCAVALTNDTSLANATKSFITFDLEQQDSHGYVSVPTQSIIIPSGQDGHYSITLWMQFSESWSLNLLSGLYVAPHATGIRIATAGDAEIVTFVAPFQPAFAQAANSVSLNLTAGYRVQVWAEQWSGAARTITHTTVWLERIDMR